MLLFLTKHISMLPLSGLHDTLHQGLSLFDFSDGFFRSHLLCEDVHHYVGDGNSVSFHNRVLRQVFCHHQPNHGLLRILLRCRVLQGDVP